MLASVIFKKQNLDIYVDNNTLVDNVNWGNNDTKIDKMVFDIEQVLFLIDDEFNIIGKELFEVKKSIKDELNKEENKCFSNEKSVLYKLQNLKKIYVKYNERYFVFNNDVDPCNNILLNSKIKDNHIIESFDGIGCYIKGDVMCYVSDYKYDSNKFEFSLMIEAN